MRRRSRAGFAGESAKLRRERETLLTYRRTQARARMHVCCEREQERARKGKNSAMQGVQPPFLPSHRPAHVPKLRYPRRLGREEPRSRYFDFQPHSFLLSFFLFLALSLSLSFSLSLSLSPSPPPPSLRVSRYLLHFILFSCVSPPLSLSSADKTWLASPPRPSNSHTPSRGENKVGGREPDDGDGGPNSHLRLRPLGARLTAYRQASAPKGERGLGGQLAS